MKPDFLIIGAPRCGTTYLSTNLASHPEIFMAVGEEDYGAGDFHYFDPSMPEGKVNHDKGINWYLKFFEGAKEGQLTGEKTADYITDPDAARLIFDEIGKTKILLMVRDPIKRAWSHFCHSRHRLPLSANFCDLLADPAPNGVNILEPGKYFQLLQAYIDLFGKDNIHIVIQDDLKNHPEETLKKACEFLCISTEHKFTKVRSRINAGSSNWKSHISARIGRWIKGHLPKLYHFLFDGPFADKTKSTVRQLRGKANETQNSATESALPTECLPALRQYYRKDVTLLGEFIGRNLISLWWKT